MGSVPGSLLIEPAERDQLLSPMAPYDSVALAVSGGGDSMALMHLVAQWRAETGDRRRIEVLTVDHGLRPESAREAAWVAAQAHLLGLSHQTVAWTGEKPRTGVQEAAREARYRVLAAYAEEHAIKALVTAHHADDQAETVLMRLARGSGVDGLSAMAPVSRIGSVALLRPLLDVPKARLATTLRRLGASSLQDPSNNDPTYERVRLRKAAATLSSLGLTSMPIVQAARRMRRARAALEDATGELAARICQLHEGAYCEADRSALQSAPEEIAVRLIMRLLTAYGGQPEPPSLARVEALQARLRDTPDVTATLGGCLIKARGGRVSVLREPGRRRLPEVALAGGKAHWDRRFAVSMPVVAGSQPCEEVRVAALGAPGLKMLRRIVPASGTILAWPVLALVTLPAVWAGDRLAAVPHLTASAHAGLGDDLPLQGRVAMHFLYRDLIVGSNTQTAGMSRLHDYS